jgi:hypothetical protein
VASSANDTYCIHSFVNLRMRGITTRPYIPMARGSPCVVSPWEALDSPWM